MFTTCLCGQRETAGVTPIGRAVQRWRRRFSLLGSLPRWERNIGAWKTVEAIGSEKPKARVSSSNLYGDDEWKARTKASILHGFQKTGQPKRPPIATARPIFSGVTLLKSAELAGRWAEISRRLCRRRDGARGSRNGMWTGDARRVHSWDQRHRRLRTRRSLDRVCLPCCRFLSCGVDPVWGA